MVMLGVVSVVWGVFAGLPHCRGRRNPLEGRERVR